MHLLIIPLKSKLKLVKEIEFYGGHGLAVQADAGNPEMVIQAVAEVARRFNRIDILVNNAGISHFGSLEAVTIADFERIIAVNVTGCFDDSREFKAYEKRRKNHKYRKYHGELFRI